jgi:hypothetical protein
MADGSSCPRTNRDTAGRASRGSPATVHSIARKPPSSTSRNAPNTPLKSRWPAPGCSRLQSTPRGHHLNVDDLDPDQAAHVRRLPADADLRISSIAFYENNLHADREYRARVNGHVLQCIDASAELGCPTVGTFIGRDTTRSVRDNLRDAEAKVSFGGLLWERPSLQVSRASHAPDRLRGVPACDCAGTL